MGSKGGEGGGGGEEERRRGGEAERHGSGGGEAWEWHVSDILTHPCSCESRPRSSSPPSWRLGPPCALLGHAYPFPQPPCPTLGKPSVWAPCLDPVGGSRPRAPRPSHLNESFGTTDYRRPMYNVTKCRIQFQYSESTITQARIQCYSPSAHAHRAQKDANLDRDRDRLETPIGNPKFESISVSLSTSAVYSNNWNYNYSLFNRRRKRVPYSNIDTYDHQIGTNITQPPSIGYRPGRQLWHNARAKSARITRRQGSSKPPSTSTDSLPILAHT